MTLKPEGRDEELAKVQQWKSVNFGSTVVQDQPQKRFEPIEYTNIPKQVRLASQVFVDAIMKQDATPFKDPHFKAFCYHSQTKTENDLLSYRWSFDHLSLRTVESLNALKFELSLDNVSLTQRSDVCTEAVSKIFKLSGENDFGHPYTINLNFPKLLVEGTALSSNSEEIPFLMSAWYNRVDASITKDALTLFFFKRYFGNPAMGFEPGQNWLRSSS